MRTDDPAMSRDHLFDIVLLFSLVLLIVEITSELDDGLSLRTSALCRFLYRSTSELDEALFDDEASIPGHDVHCRGRQARLKRRPFQCDVSGRSRVPQALDPIAMSWLALVLCIQMHSIRVRGWRSDMRFMQRRPS